MPRKRTQSKLIFEGRFVILDEDLDFGSITILKNIRPHFTQDLLIIKNAFEV
jgi:hypothetical protein